MEDTYIPDHDRIISLEHQVKAILDIQEENTQTIKLHNKELMKLGNAQCKKLDEIKLILAKNNEEQYRYCSMRTEKYPTWSVVTWILGFIIICIIGSYGYTNAVDIKHTKCSDNIKEIITQHKIEDITNKKAP